MAMKRLRPAGGWPAFYTEIVVIVIGAFLALSLQQIVEGLRWAREVGEFRTALDQELRYNLGGYQDRIGQSRCIKARLDQLDEWQRRSRAREKLELVSQIVRPLPIAPRTSVWESRTPDVVGHLGLQQRIDFAYYSDALRTYGELARRERDDWTRLMEFSGARDLDQNDLARLRGLIDAARLTNQLINDNWEPLRKRAARYGISGKLETGEKPWDRSLCDPLVLRPA